MFKHLHREYYTQYVVLNYISMYSLKFLKQLGSNVINCVSRIYFNLENV